MQIRPTALTFGLIIYSFIALFYVYTEFGIDSDRSLLTLWGAVFFYTRPFTIHLFYSHKKTKNR